ncbi:MAG: (d)CMP kinase [Lachnospiraceae bacterium]|nr:(d)CMP kinase [Lachnospiraceae bacterium]
MNIAIDGPAGAGKSTIAKLVADKKGFIYVDTGAMYRSIALYIIENNINSDDELDIKNACENIDIKLKHEDGVQHIYLNERDVSTDIRREEVGNMASKAAAKKVVRDKLLNLQRDIAASNDVIMDGRDIGTFVLPNAELKIYLTASVMTRAKRRFDQLVEKGESLDIDKIAEDIEKRDYQDMHRDIAPLKQADDAILLDTSDMTVEEVINKISDLIDNVNN